MKKEEVILLLRPEYAESLKFVISQFDTISNYKILKIRKNLSILNQIKNNAYKLVVIDFDYLIEIKENDIDNVLERIEKAYDKTKLTFLIKSHRKFCELFENFESKNQYCATMIFFPFREEKPEYNVIEPYIKFRKDYFIKGYYPYLKQKQDKEYLKVNRLINNALKDNNVFQALYIYAELRSIMDGDFCNGLIDDLLIFPAKHSCKSDFKWPEEDALDEDRFSLTQHDTHYYSPPLDLDKIKLAFEFSAIMLIEDTAESFESFKAVVDELVKKNSLDLIIFFDKEKNFGSKLERKLYSLKYEIDYYFVKPPYFDKSSISDFKKHIKKLFLSHHYYIKNIFEHDVAPTNTIIYNKNNLLMKKNLATASNVAKTGISVFLTGETGTGKNLFAQYIHKESDRAKEEFVSIAANTLLKGTAKSELFGHEKGAYTDADKQKIGKIEQANKGTLFIDEIGDLDIDVQKMLLQAIDDKKIQRMGGDKDIQVDFRLITASHKNLEEMMKQELFRRDLYYRISVKTIELPPLRKRLDDINELAQYFLEEFNEIHKKKIEFSSDVIPILTTYDWPGNVRELKHVVENMATSAIKNEYILCFDIPTNILNPDKKQKESEKCSCQKIKEMFSNEEFPKYNDYENVITKTFRDMYKKELINKTKHIKKKGKRLEEAIKISSLNKNKLRENFDFKNW